MQPRYPAVLAALALALSMSATALRAQTPPPPPSGTAIPTAVPTGDVASKQIGGANFRLIDVSFDVLAAAGGSTVSDSALGNLEGGDHDPRKNGFTIQNTELSLSGAIDPYLGGE